MAALPDFLSLARERAHARRERSPLTRQLLLGGLGLFVLLGLANLFGQRPQTDVVESSVGSLKVYSPERVRGGLYFESRFTIVAREEIENATLLLDPGWLEGMTLNTLAPGPVGEASRDGSLAFELGHVPAGDTHRFFLHFQVNPTNVGHRSQDVDLFDGERHLLHLDRTITIWP